MKKTYKIPTMLVVKLKSEPLMLVTSDKNATDGEVLGRRARFSEWEDEEEEY